MENKAQFPSCQDQHMVNAPIGSKGHEETVFSAISAHAYVHGIRTSGRATLTPGGRGVQALTSFQRV